MKPLKSICFFSDLNYTVNSYEIPHSYGSVWPENSNNLLCFVDLKVYNSTNSKINLKEYYTSKIAYFLVCDGVEYRSTRYLYNEEYLLYHDDIDARETIEADLLFEAPKEVLENAQKLELRIKLNKDDAKDIHIVTLKG